MLLAFFITPIPTASWWRGSARCLEDNMLLTLIPVAAAGWAFLVWLVGGGFGLALLVFLGLKLLGK